MEVLCYTREPEEDIIYANRLAYSMHLAFQKEDGKFTAFHHNEGLLYAKAVQKESGELTAKSLKNPWLFGKVTGGFGVMAVRTEAEGEMDPQSEGCVLLWRSEDLVHYREVGLLRLQNSGYINQVRCEYREKTGYLIEWEVTDGTWMQANVNDVFDTADILNGSIIEEPTICMVFIEKKKTSGIKGMIPGNVISISEEQGEYLLKKLTVPEGKSLKLSSAKSIFSREELGGIRALVSYSDGTTVARQIDWEKENGSKAGIEKKRGRVHQEQFNFPFAEYRADPCCMYWHGKYYFIATNDFDDNRSLYIRCADKLEDIVTADEILLLDTSMYPEIGGLLWAPEFHEIEGRLYIFHAATKGEFFWEESRVMMLKEEGDPMNASDWSAPKLVVKKDGTSLCEAGKVISLDMTTFPYENRMYAMWSQRQFLPVDQGAWLFLAEIDKKTPWKLVTDPVCIAKPEYGWENNHTFVVEGPFALERNGQLMVTYSGAGIDTTYTVGLLKPKMGKDILDPYNWEKSNYPLLSSRSCEGQYGPGHNSYMEDENGLVWNFYHGRAGTEAPRSSGGRRVHFDIDGEPMLDVLEKFDLPETLREVEVTVNYDL